WNDAPASDIHFHDWIMLIRVDLAELRSYKVTSVEQHRAWLDVWIDVIPLWLYLGQINSDQHNPIMEMNA
ncbi:hypothetical protein O0I10_012716, partial [Lichtheimia ornata]